jgi:hypothetical protein
MLYFQKDAVEFREAMRAFLLSFVGISYAGEVSSSNSDMVLVCADVLFVDGWLYVDEETEAKAGCI